MKIKNYYIFTNELQLINGREILTLAQISIRETIIFNDLKISIVLPMRNICNDPKHDSGPNSTFKIQYN